MSVRPNTVGSSPRSGRIRRLWDSRATQPIVVADHTVDAVPAPLGQIVGGPSLRRFAQPQLADAGEPQVPPVAERGELPHVLDPLGLRVEHDAADVAEIEATSGRALPVSSGPGRSRRGRPPAGGAARCRSTRTARRWCLPPARVRCCSPNSTCTTTKRGRPRRLMLARLASRPVTVARHVCSSTLGSAHLAVAEALLVGVAVRARAAAASRVQDAGRARPGRRQAAVARRMSRGTRSSGSFRVLSAAGAHGRCTVRPRRGLPHPAGSRAPAQRPGPVRSRTASAAMIVGRQATRCRALRAAVADLPGAAGTS